MHGTAKFMLTFKRKSVLPKSQDSCVVSVHSPLGTRASRPPELRPRWPRSQEKAGGLNAYVVLG